MSNTDLALRIRALLRGVRPERVSETRGTRRRSGVRLRLDLGSLPSLARFAVRLEHTGRERTTDDLDLGVGVTCPTMRIHLAILAQAVATTATMLQRRFFFGVGTGEQLNEHVLGDRWPPHSVRMEMLEESIEVIRKL